MRGAGLLLRLAALGVAVLGWTAPASAQDARRGREVYAACAACHDPGPSALGPPLAGVVGRAAGTVEGFRYSGALRRSGLVWTPQTLQRFILDPQGVVKGNRMPFSGLPVAHDAADLVAYLETLK